MKIGNFEFKNNLILAPMAGVTDVAFRSICIDLGCDAGVTEMVSAKALDYDNKKTQELLLTAPNEKIKIVQIFGHEPEIMAKICGSSYINKFDIILSFIITAHISVNDIVIYDKFLFKVLSFFLKIGTASVSAGAEYL